MTTSIGMKLPDNGAVTGQQNRYANMAALFCLKPGMLAAAMGLAFAEPVLAAETVRNSVPVKKIAKSVCAPCHGAVGNGVTPEIPKLAGLSRDYLVKQMNDFIAGKRKHDMEKDGGAGVKEAEVAPLAAYYAGQKLKSGKVTDAELAEEGKQIFLDGNTEAGLPACQGCHGADGAGVAQAPRLAGQFKEYILVQLDKFGSGMRTNDLNSFMQVVAERMTEQEMLAVSEYLSGLKVRQ